MRFFAFIFAAMLVAGCSTTLVREEPRGVSVASGVEVETLPLAEALLAHERGVSAEALEVTWKDKAFTAEMVVKGDGEKLTMVLLAPQMRLATLTIDKPHRIVWERSSRVPGVLAPEYVIADVAFVRLPTSVLSAALGSDFKVKDDGRRRVVSHGGTEVRTLDRLEDGTLKFSNPYAEYSCRIVSMEAGE